MARFTSLEGISRRSSTSGIGVGTRRASSKAASLFPRWNLAKEPNNKTWVTGVRGHLHWPMPACEFRPDTCTPAWTSVQIWAFPVEPSVFDEESPVPDSWFEKRAASGSPQEIKPHVFEWTPLTDKERPEGRCQGRNDSREVPSVKTLTIVSDPSRWKRGISRVFLFPLSRSSVPRCVSASWSG